MLRNLLDNVTAVNQHLSVMRHAEHERADVIVCLIKLLDMPLECELCLVPRRRETVLHITTGDHSTGMLVEQAPVALRMRGQASSVSVPFAMMRVLPIRAVVRNPNTEDARIILLGLQSHRWVCCRACQRDGWVSEDPPRLVKLQEGEFEHFALVLLAIAGRHDSVDNETPEDLHGCDERRALVKLVRDIRGSLDNMNLHRS
mmetsp:Transcript_32981/g.80184  ORF Transcript_32981/g.80184 Transcript_32981/m.80184 type:complete len:202 (-) Transcript_32981:703-1308(-)